MPKINPKVNQHTTSATCAIISLFILLLYKGSLPKINLLNLIPLNSPSLFTIKHTNLLIIPIQHHSILFPIITFHNNPITLFQLLTFNFHLFNYMRVPSDSDMSTKSTCRADMSIFPQKIDLSMLSRPSIDIINARRPNRARYRGRARGASLLRRRTPGSSRAPSRAA